MDFNIITHPLKPRLLFTGDDVFTVELSFVSVVSAKKKKIKFV